MMVTDVGEDCPEDTDSLGYLCTHPPTLSIFFFPYPHLLIDRGDNCIIFYYLFLIF